MKIITVGGGLDWDDAAGDWLVDLRRAVVEEVQSRCRSGSSAGLCPWLGPYPSDEFYLDVWTAMEEGWVPLGEYVVQKWVGGVFKAFLDNRGIDAQGRPI